MLKVTIDELATLGEVELGYSEWIYVDQDMIDQFARLTRDEQWIHVDVERANNGPFGATIAHGYMSVSLLSHMVESLIEVEGAGKGLNYGLAKVRFPSPLPVDSKIRGRVWLKATKPVENGVQLECSVVVEREGQEKPICVAEPIYRYYR